MASWCLENSVDSLVIAHCRDYRRRAAAIEERSMPRRVDNELRYYNFKIYDAVASVVGEGRAEAFIREIGDRIGYAKSEFMDEMSECTYKEVKRRIKDTIAAALYLVKK